jgi:diadenylate cyclase
MEQPQEDNNEKKEVQRKIIEVQPINEKASEEDLVSILRLVAPGTNLRTALEGIVKIGKGALIVVENESTNEIIDGGFKLNCRFTPQKLMELSKMDGALILSEDMKKIMYCNVLMTPDSKIPSHETGTRHRAAERTAKMTGTLVIAVSERKNEIHIYYKDIKYHLKDTSEVLRKTNSILQLMEKQREDFDKSIKELDKMELKNDTYIAQACKTIQRGESIRRLVKTIEKSVIELGNEAGLIKPRIKELVKDVYEETNLVIKDYTKLNIRKSRSLIDSLSYEELTDTENIVMSLAQKETTDIDSIKGWRMLSKTNIIEQDAALLLKELGNLDKIINSDQVVFNRILGEEKASLFTKSLNRIK